MCVCLESCSVSPSVFDRSGDVMEGESMIESRMLDRENRRGWWNGEGDDGDGKTRRKDGEKEPVMGVSRVRFPVLLSAGFVTHMHRGSVNVVRNQSKLWQDS